MRRHRDRSLTYEELQSSLLIMRRAMGWCGILLPTLCLLYTVMQQGGVIEPSVSAYYYTRVHGAFVGILCTMGMVFLCYVVPNKMERGFALVGSVAAFGVGLFPTSDSNPGRTYFADKLVTPYTGVAGNIHMVSAIVLFLIFMVFAGSFFVRDEKSDTEFPLEGPEAWRSLFRMLGRTLRFYEWRTLDVGIINPQKRKRNFLYRLCALLIAAALSIIALSKILNWHHSVFFWGEVLAILAFATSWLTKAEHVLTDQGKMIDLTGSVTPVNAD